MLEMKITYFNKLYFWKTTVLKPLKYKDGTHVLLHDGLPMYMEKKNFIVPAIKRLFSYDANLSYLQNSRQNVWLSPGLKINSQANLIAPFSLLLLIFHYRFFFKPIGQLFANTSNTSVDRYYNLLLNRLALQGAGIKCMAKHQSLKSGLLLAVIPRFNRSR